MCTHSACDAFAYSSTVPISQVDFGFYLVGRISKSFNLVGLFDQIFTMLYRMVC